MWSFLVVSEIAASALDKDVKVSMHKTMWHSVVLMTKETEASKVNPAILPKSFSDSESFTKIRKKAVVFGDLWDITGQKKSNRDDPGTGLFVC